VSPGRIVKRNAPAALLLQGIDDDRIDPGTWPLNPKRLEDGELLTRRIGCVDSEPPSGQTVTLALADRAEVAGAEKGGDLVVIVGSIERRVDAEPGEADILIWRALIGAEGEEVRVVVDRLRRAVENLVEIDPICVEKASVKQLQGEEQPLVAPPSTLRVETDIAVLIIVQMCERVGQFAVGRLIRLLCQLLGYFAWQTGIERGGLLRRRGRGSAQRLRDRSEHCQRGSGDEQGSALHLLLRFLRLGGRRAGSVARA
jgi:hypothetical protein